LSLTPKSYFDLKLIKISIDRDTFHILYTACTDNIVLIASHIVIVLRHIQGCNGSDEISFKSTKRYDKIKSILDINTTYYYFHLSTPDFCIAALI